MKSLVAAIVAGILSAGISLAPTTAMSAVHGPAAVAASGSPVPHQERAVTFTDTHQVLHGNPYTGTAFDINSPKPATSQGYTFTTDPAITDFIEGRKRIPDDADIVRVQIAWADFEPGPNKFSWHRFDEFMKRINQQGKTAEIQLLMSDAPDVKNDPGVFPYQYPPAWLFDVEKAPYRLAQYNGKYYSKQPLYYSPIYLNALSKAVHAFAKRYDSNKGIAWVDLRAFSLFGEWSGWNDALNFPWPDNATRTKTLHTILGIYSSAFRKTMVMMENPGANVDPNDPDANTQAKRFTAYGYDVAAANKNWGFRSDTVNSAFPWMQYDTSGETSYINRLERRDHVQVSEGSTWNSSVMLNNPRLVVKNAIEAYHSNLQGINNTSFVDWDAMKKAYGEWFTTLARYSGYRFLMQRATYTDTVRPGGTLDLSQTWTNNGAGFSPKKYPIKVYLLDQSSGRVVWSGTDSSVDETTWFKGDADQVRSSFTLPHSVRPGSYTLALAMVDSTGEPRIELAMPNGKDKIYPIGPVTVTGSAPTAQAQAARAQFRIENEDYTAAQGAYGVEPPAEGGFGALYMGNSGDWAEYNNVTVPETGTYRAEFRVSASRGDHFRVLVDGKDATGSIGTPDTGGYNVYGTIEREIPLTAGRHTIRIVRDDGNWFFMNWMRFTLANPDEFTIQAESATDQSGTWLNALDDVDDDGTPGVSVIDSGDWLSYDNVDVAQSATYLMQFRYSTTNSDPLSFRLEVDGKDATGPLSLDPTGGVTTMKTANFFVPLAAGKHTFKVVWITADSNIVWNWMRFDRQGDYHETIAAGDYNMQWNLAKEYSWDGPDTGVVAGTYHDDGKTVTAVGSIDQQDYLRYENIYVPYTGYYKLDLRVASDQPQQLQFDVDGDATTVNVPDTGGDGHFENISTPVEMTAGIHNLRFIGESARTKAGVLFEDFGLTATTDVLKAVSASGPTSMAVGDTGKLTATAISMDGSHKTVTDSVTYSSSDTSVATVDSDGTVTAKGWGTAALSVELNGLTSSITVTVTDPNVTLTTVNDTDPGITYSGSWGTDTHRGFGDFDDDVHYSTVAGDYAEYTFTGTGIAFLTERYTDMGSVDIAIDGVKKATINCFGSPRTAQQPVFVVRDLAPGTHTIRVTNDDTYASDGRIAIVDAFIVQQPKVS
ncbi:carbohydrate-binding protein [Humibacter sp.]|uniref:carbohydrate-binding protein n=1 Tax=Humibacter sp. TaxID=1940291 RepID=UPI003F7F41D6